MQSTPGAQYDERRSSMCIAARRTATIQQNSRQSWPQGIAGRSSNSVSELERRTVLCGEISEFGGHSRPFRISPGMETIEERLQRLGIALPNLSSPLANYVPFIFSGDLLLLSGQGPRGDDGNWRTGKLGQD